MTYRGRPWRSRFLRAPKEALKLEALGVFAPLGELSRVALGMKTGADKFFYVTPLSDQQEEELKAAKGLSRRPPGHIAVQGLANWKGFVSGRDLKPSIRNPHELFGDSNDRRFLIPSQTASYYLYPRDRAPQGDLADYVRHGERLRIHSGELVTGNASTNRWYRQARGLVDSPVALPYNSAYDYGAWDNATRAVLNGRFLGVTPADGVDVRLLLAALNTTFCVVSRLTEGVATGVEAAFDVGPPAARLMLVPDVRRMSDSSRAAIIELTEEMRQRNLIPPAPARDGSVHELRKRLDRAVLESLGVSRGDAQFHIGRIVASYARWRASVEDVEARMRVHRRGMTRGGGSRLRPLELLAERIWTELADRVRLIPQDSLPPSCEVERVDVSRGWRAPPQEPLLEAGHVELADGEMADLGSWARVEYLSMARTMGFEPPVSVPVDAAVAARVVADYEREQAYLAGLVQEAGRELVDGDGLTALVRLVKRVWHKACREAG